MPLRYRQMQQKDVAMCVDIVASNPVLGPRYGPAISDLERTWLCLLKSAAFTSVVFEEFGKDGHRVVGGGISTFISDKFLQEMKSPPLVWIGPEIVRRVSCGDSPVLSDKQMAVLNTRGGLNLYGWHAAMSEECGNRVDFLNAIFAGFVELHCGFQINEVLGQADSVGMVEAMFNTGAGYFDPKVHGYVQRPPASATDILNRPHLIGQTREMAVAGGWLSGSSLFSWQVPKFAFRRSEQRLLWSALKEGTDEDLSNELSVSLSCVRKMWLTIYDHVAACAPEIFVEPSYPCNEKSARGKGKKHRLLAYLREHPEEIRPISRKLLGKGAATQQRF